MPTRKKVTANLPSRPGWTLLTRQRLGRAHRAQMGVVGDLVMGSQIANGHAYGVVAVGSGSHSSVVGSSW